MSDEDDHLTPEQKANVDALALTIGVHMECVVNLISDSLGRACTMRYSMGLNTVPREQDIDRVIVDAVEDCNARYGAQDFRLMKAEDVGLAPMPETEWPPHPEESSPGSIVPERPQ